MLLAVLLLLFALHQPRSLIRTSMVATHPLDNLIYGRIGLLKILGQHLMKVRLWLQLIQSTHSPSAVPPSSSWRSPAIVVVLLTGMWQLKRETGEQVGAGALCRQIVKTPWLMCNAAQTVTGARRPLKSARSNAWKLTPNRGNERWAPLTGGTAWWRRCDWAPIGFSDGR